MWKADKRWNGAESKSREQWETSLKNQHCVPKTTKI